MLVCRILLAIEQIVLLTKCASYAVSQNFEQRDKNYKNCMFIRTSSSLMQGTNFIDGQNNLYENVVHLYRSMFIDQSD